MLSKMNEQVRKHRENILRITREKEVELVELQEFFDGLVVGVDGSHSDVTDIQVNTLSKQAQVTKRYNKLLEQQERVLEGKIARREEWLSEKRVVARKRIQKVLDRAEGLEFGEALRDVTKLSDKARVEALEGAVESGLKYANWSMARKELAVMVADVFGGMDEIEEADLELWKEISEVFH